MPIYTSIVGSEGGTVRGQTATDWKDIRGNAQVASGGGAVCIGSNNTASHFGSIMIGVGLRSDYPCQVKIGTANSNVTLGLDTENYLLFRKSLDCVLNKA